MSFSYDFLSSFSFYYLLITTSCIVSSTFVFVETYNLFVINSLKVVAVVFFIPIVTSPLIACFWSCDSIFNIFQHHIDALDEYFQSLRIDQDICHSYDPALKLLFIYLLTFFWLFLSSFTISFFSSPAFLPWRNHLPSYHGGHVAQVNSGQSCFMSKLCPLVQLTFVHLCANTSAEFLIS